MSEPNVAAPCSSSSLTRLRKPAAGQRRLRDREPANLLGQFLVDGGAITADELSAALSLMGTLNERIGALAVARGWLTQRQADHIAGLQRTIDARWGDIAVALEEGGLTQEQVEELHWEQTEDNLRLGDALVEVGALSCSEAETWLARHEAAKSITVMMADDPRGEYDPIRHAADGLPRVLLRRVGLHAAVSMPRVFRAEDGRDHKRAAVVRLAGGWSAALGLSLSPRLARALSNRGTDRGPRKDRAIRVVSDLLEVLAQYVARRLDRDHAAQREACVVGPVEIGAVPARGLSFTVATDFGDALLIVDNP